MPWLKTEGTLKMEIIHNPQNSGFQTLTGGPSEITHQCAFSGAVNREKGQTETKLYVISCEDIGSKILNVEVLNLEVLIITLEATLKS